MQLKKLEDITNNLKKEDEIHNNMQGLSLNQIIPQVTQDSRDQEKMSLSTLYNCVVERLLYASSRKENAMKMLSRDNAPQLFECLLSNSKPDLKDLLRLGDLIVKSDIDSTTSCLRLLTLNMSRHMLEFSSRCIDNLIFFVEPYKDAEGKTEMTLKYQFKDEYYRSCSTVIPLGENVSILESNVGIIETSSKKQESSGAVTNQTESKSSSEPFQVEVLDVMGIVRQWISFENEDDKKTAIGALIEDPSKYGSIVKINYRKKVSWDAIKGMSFLKVQKICGDGSPIEIMQFVHEDLISKAFKREYDGSDENLRAFVVKVRNKDGIVCDSFKIENMEDRSKSIGSLINATSEIRNVVEINGKTMTWNAIKDKSFQDVQLMCGEDTPIRELQFCR